jgi:hypothetical protein
MLQGSNISVRKIIKHFLLTYSNMAITRLLLEAASANATENMTMVSDEDYEIVYASGAVMLKAVGSFMLIFLSFFLK